MLAAAVTELLELETAGGRLLVLGRRVIPLLALSALQCHNFPHPAYPLKPTTLPALADNSIPRINSHRSRRYFELGLR